MFIPHRNNLQVIILCARTVIDLRQAQMQHGNADNNIINGELSMDTGLRLHPQRLHHFIEKILHYAGSEPQEARLVADHLLAANLAGHDSHGVGMIPSYVRSLEQGYLQLNRHASVVKDMGAVVTLNGNQAFGQVAAHEAISLGIEKARQHGLAAVALHNSHHIGRIGYWAEQCAAAGFISIHFVNVVGDPMVAPFGGKDSRFGTNPFCVVFPGKGNRHCCWTTQPAPLHLEKRAWLTTKASRCPMAVLLTRRGFPLTTRRLCIVRRWGHW
jgi:uncharacterized oxidoreductase